MRDYVIITDTGCDLEGGFREQFGIEYVPMHYSFEGKDYEADLDWKNFTAKEFYNHMRDGKRFITAQVNANSYRTAFEKAISEGKDVLYLGTSSALSASVKSSCVVRDELLKKYPEAKIVCLDMLRACYALGLLAIRASELRAEGKTIEETAQWLEENKLTVHMEGTVDKLIYLKQAGRVSAASAFFGGLLNIKPIIIADALGRNFAAEKVKGRLNAFQRIADRVAESFEDVPYQRVFISHADCLEEAEEFKNVILSKLGRDVEVHIGYVGPCVGSSVGPGMLGVYYYGKKVTTNQEG